MTDIRRMKGTSGHEALLSAKPESNQQGIYSIMITDKYDAYWSGTVMSFETSSLGMCVGARSLQKTGEHLALGKRQLLEWSMSEVASYSCLSSCG